MQLGLTHCSGLLARRCLIAMCGRDLLEMKERLSWPATESAGFQFLAGRQLLGLTVAKGIIVFKTWAEQLA